MEGLFSHQRLVLAGGRPGVGATTLSLAVAQALARDGLRVVLVDADLARGDLTAACRVQPRADLADVLSGRRSVHEALVLGPAGIQVLPGSASAAARDGLRPRDIQRLLRQLEELRPHADWLVIDAGNQPSDLAAHLWATSDRLLVVTSPDAAAVMDTYALIKSTVSSLNKPPLIGVLVNQATSERVASDVHRRIDQSCRRFLGLSLQLVGAVPPEPQAHEALTAGSNAGPASTTFRQAASTVVRWLGERNGQEGGRLRPAA